MVIFMAKRALGIWERGRGVAKGERNIRKWDRDGLRRREGGCKTEGRVGWVVFCKKKPIVYTEVMLKK